MTILVTGSSGYVGIGIIKVLLDHGCRVTGFSIDPLQDFSNDPNFHQIIGDVTQFGEIFDALDGIEVVVHSAVGSRIAPELLTKYEGGHSGDLHRVVPFQINVGGSYNVFEASQQRSIRQVINISSCAVIYHHIIDPVDQHVNKVFVDAHTPPAFRGEYGLSKYLQEQIGWHYAQSYGLSVPTFRPWWVVDAATGLTRLNDRLVDDPVDQHVNKVFVDAHTPPAFRGEYGLSKYLQEQIGWHYAQSYGLSVPTFRPWWVVDAATGLTRLNDRLVDDPVDALGSAGWIDRYDLGEAVLAAIKRPDLTQEIFYPMSTLDSHSFFDVNYLEEKLGWQPRFRFEEEARLRKIKGIDPY